MHALHALHALHASLRKFGWAELHLCANEWYATGTSTEGWHVVFDSLLIGDQTMLIDQQLASTAIPQHAGHMVFGGSICLKFQCFVCSPEETLAFFR